MTPDSDLLLAFPASLIPSGLHSLVPAGVHLRPLASTDHSRSHLAVLAILSPSPDPGAARWEAQFHALVATKDTYYPIVLVDDTSDQILALGTVFLERKFLRELASAGHIEDIAVSEKAQGKGLGKVVIQVLTALSESLGAYKTILDCDPKNEGFYVKCGYENKGVEMAKYAKKD
ncbi:hypothetical protein RQP46_006391 [Phenoliferia psychrophenolica]